MGWCSGTNVFDAICDIVLSEKPVDKKAVVKHIIRVLQDMDWDCESDSNYWEHPVVREVFREINPEWFEEEK